MWSLEEMDNYCCLTTPPEILSVENIAKVRNRLESLDALSHELETCLDYALLKFSREDSCLQENAWLVICCEEKKLEFISGKGESKIEISIEEGIPCYKVHLPKFGGAVKISPWGLLLLSVENLEEIAREIISWREMTKGLKACLEYSWSHFAQEPFRVQNNCWMVIEADGRKMKLISGEGSNYIHIYQKRDRTIQYDIQFSTFSDCFVRALTPTVWYPNFAKRYIAQWGDGTEGMQDLS